MSEFKIGDWVRHNEGLTRIKGLFSKSSVNRGGTWLSEDYSNGRTIPAKDCELWRPKPDEWCWLYYDGIENTPVLSKVLKVEGDGTVVTYEKTFGCSYWDASNVLPFIGELPTCLKDK